MMVATWITDSTPQQIFDRVASGLKNQGFKHSMEWNPHGHQVKTYTYDDSGSPLASVVGHLMTPDEWEILGGKDQSWNAWVHRGNVPREHLHLIELLEDVHNFSLISEHEMEKRLRKLADIAGFSVQVLDT